MNPKSMLIPTAALATTMTGISACAKELEAHGKLTKRQIAAFEKAHKLRAEGEHIRARNVLKRAGIDLKTLESIRKAMHKMKCKQMSDPLHEAVWRHDFIAFRNAISDSPLADLITTPEDFELFVETYQRNEEREEEIVHAIAEDLKRERELFGRNWFRRYLGLHNVHLQLNSFRIGV